MNLEGVSSYAWGAATLAYMYRQLGKASRFQTKQICGCLTLLQAWIYEYFPRFRPTENGNWEKQPPYAARWVPGKMKKTNDDLLIYRAALDCMTVDEVTWTPFTRDPSKDVPISRYCGIIHCRSITEPYMPIRVLRQFGYVQVIPPCPFVPNKVYKGSNIHKYNCVHDPMITNWRTWQQHLMQPGILGSFRARFTTEVADNYISWFKDRTHPKVQHITGPSPMHQPIPFNEMPDRAV